MMYGMKAIWKGFISFALVSIPVKLYAATKKKDVRFHMLHRKCSTPLRYDRHCPVCDETVPWEDVTHGYELEKDTYVVVTDEELENLPVKTSRRIDILRFVDKEDIEPIYYDKAYYLEPVEGGERAYALLRDTIERTGKLPLAKISMRDKEHVAVLAVHGSAIVLQTLFYGDEVRKPGELNLPGEMKLEKTELGLAMELVKRYEGDFDIKKYHDEFRDSLMELIEAKAAGKEMKAVPGVEERKVINLMDALRRSVKKTGISEPKKRKRAG